MSDYLPGFQFVRTDPDTLVARCRLCPREFANPSEAELQEHIAEHVDPLVGTVGMRPRDGDVVLTCGHEDVRHLWWAPISFKRPDGTTGEAKWRAACRSCFDAAGGNADKVPMREDTIWKGDEPMDFLT